MNKIREEEFPVLNNKEIESMIYTLMEDAGDRVYKESKGNSLGFDIMMYINQLEADNKTLKSDLLEMSKHISNRYETYEGDYCECIHCLQGGWRYKHENDCPVLKAEEIIRNNKE